MDRVCSSSPSDPSDWFWGLRQTLGSRERELERSLEVKEREQRKWAAEARAAQHRCRELVDEKARREAFQEQYHRQREARYQQERNEIRSIVIRREAEVTDARMTARLEQNRCNELCEEIRETVATRHAAEDAFEEQSQLLWTLKSKQQELLAELRNVQRQETQSSELTVEITRSEQECLTLRKEMEESRASNAAAFDALSEQAYSTQHALIEQRVQAEKRGQIATKEAQDMAKSLQEKLEASEATEASLQQELHAEVAVSKERLNEAEANTTTLMALKNDEGSAKSELASLKKDLEEQHELRCKLQATEVTLQQNIKIEATVTRERANEAETSKTMLLMLKSELGSLKKELEGQHELRSKMHSLKKDLDAEKKTCKKQEIEAQKESASFKIARDHMHSEITALVAESHSQQKTLSGLFKKLEEAAEEKTTSTSEIASLQRKVDAGTKLCKSLAEERNTLREKMKTVSDCAPTVIDKDFDSGVSGPSGCGGASSNNEGSTTNQSGNDGALGNAGASCNNEALGDDDICDTDGPLGNDGACCNNEGACNKAVSDNNEVSNDDVILGNNVDSCSDESAYNNDASGSDGPPENSGASCNDKAGWLD